MRRTWGWFVVGLMAVCGAGAALAQRPAQIDVAPPPSLTCASSSAQVGQPYSSILVATDTGGVPVNYALATNIYPGDTIEGATSFTPASPPPGLTLNATSGAITGTPTQAGVFPYTPAVTFFYANALPAPTDGITIFSIGCSITVAAGTATPTPTPISTPTPTPISTPTPTPISTPTPTPISTPTPVFTPAATPAPASVTLVLVGMAALFAFGRRRNSQSSERNK